MKRIGLAERTGRGIDRIYEGSLLYGRQLPDYSQSNATSVRLLIPKGPVDKAFIQMVSEEQQRIGHSLPIHSLMALNALKVLHRASVNEIASFLHKDEAGIRSVLESLAENGLVDASGTGRGGTYLLSERYYKKPYVYVRSRDINTLRYEELIMELAGHQGHISRADVVELLHVMPSQAFRLLQKLVKAERLILTGKGAGAKCIPRAKA